MEEILSCVDAFCYKIEQALIHNRRKETVSLDFRGDVYKFLFKEKGYMLGRWQVLEKNDFLAQYFQDGWDSRMNMHGEGMKLHFPVTIRWFLCWSPLKFKNINGDYAPSTRAPFEKLSVQIIKVAP